MANVAVAAEGTITTTGSEQDIYEVTGDEYYSISIEVAGASSGVTLLRTYQKAIQTGSFVCVHTETIQGLQSDDPLFVSIPFSASTGLKWTIQTTAGGFFDCDYHIDQVV